MTTILLGRVCRTCLKKSKNMHKLSHILQDDLQIEEMLKRSIPNFELQMDDVPFPLEMCEECLKTLHTAYEFVQMCWNTNKVLRSIMNQQEQEIEACMVGCVINENAQDILADTDVLRDNFKKETHGDNSIHITPKVNINDNPVEAFKVEVLNDTSVFLETITTHSLVKKPKRNCARNAEAKRLNSKICLHCNKHFSKKKFLSEHLCVHDPANEFLCDICSYRFASERKLKNHIKVQHTELKTSKTSAAYSCPEQKLSLVTNRAVHFEFKCQVCCKNHKTLSDMTEHMNSEHPDVLPFKCHLCEKAFAMDQQLKYHINEHMGYKSHKCNLCEKSFLNLAALRDHESKHSTQLPFLCPHCGKSFKTANILRLHMQRHGEKKLSCSECPMKFYVQSKLSEHMSLHTKLKPYICDICGKAFTRPYSLKAHMFAHSGERPFKCEVCNMSFVFKRHWKRHKLTHTGEKPHMCSFCDRAYAASGDLVKHLRTHVGEKTYFCDQCPEAFKYSMDLKDHKVRHYKEKLNMQQNNYETSEISINN